MFLKTFGASMVVAAIGLTLGFLYGGPTGLAVTAILAVLEVSLSFDNAVVNATVLVRMNPFWQKIFLTVGVAIAVFGMRLVFPLLIVGITAKLTPAEAIRLALEKGDPKQHGTYGYLLDQAHPAIAAFGGVFLLVLFLDFILEEREITWLSWLERPLARIGKLDQLSVVITLVALAIAAYALAPSDKVSTVLLSGTLGMVTYLVVNGLGEFFETEEDEVVEAAVEGGAAKPAGSGGGRVMVQAVGKAGAGCPAAAHHQVQRPRGRHRSHRGRIYRRRSGVLDRAQSGLRRPGRSRWTRSGTRGSLMGVE